MKGDKQNYKNNEIYQRQLALRHHRIMNNKESNSHGNDHRQENDSLQKTGNQEKRAAEFAEGP